MKSVQMPSYFIYARKSTDDEGRQVLSLDSQVNELTTLALKEGLKVIEVLRESKSAKMPGRPIFDAMLERIQAGEANGIIAWKLDRLSRNSVDSGHVQWVLQNGIISHIKTAERDYYPEDNVLMATLEFGMANQYIRDLSKNVKRGLKAKLEMGIRPGVAALGYLNTANPKDKGRNEITQDPERFEHVKRMWHLMLTGNYSVAEILRVANNEWEFTSRSGKSLSRSAIYKLLSNSFYYGQYEYGGQTWSGIHEPMITEDEYWRVQELLGRKGRQRAKQNREFDFTGMMECGNCGAMITAELKTKRYKNGTSKSYVYYHCTKRKDPDCPERSIELDELNLQVDSIISTLGISERFNTWAIKYLHEVRQSEAATHESALENKQKQLRRVVAQLHSLNLRYLSPENSDSGILSTEEYQTLKSTFTVQKQTLEKGLASVGAVIEEEIELSERTFNFVRYARLWYKNGNRHTRRAIFAALGSNLVLTNQMVAIKLHPVFQTIAENLVKIEDELGQVRTPEDVENTGRNTETWVVSPALRCTLDKIRTFFEMNPDEEI